MHLACLEEFGGQHRGKGDGDSGRSDDDDGDDPAQLFEHDARHTLEHSQRHEHSSDDEGGGDNGYPDLVGGVDSGLAGVLSTFDMLGDILQHDDSIIHDHTDGNVERTERDHVQRRASQGQVDECDDK